MNVSQAKPSLAFLWLVGVGVVAFGAGAIGAFSVSIPGPPGALRQSVMDSAWSTRAAGAARATPVQATSRTSILCAQCGVILSLREDAWLGDRFGPAVDVTGAVARHRLGYGRGLDASSVLGTIGSAGSQIDQRGKSARAFQITVRLDDGTSRVVDQPDSPAWRTGDKVKFMNGVLVPNA